MKFLCWENGVLQIFPQSYDEKEIKKKSNVTREYAILILLECGVVHSLV